jgi:hypothetical protein
MAAMALVFCCVPIRVPRFSAERIRPPPRAPIVLTAGMSGLRPYPFRVVEVTVKLYALTKVT